VEAALGTRLLVSSKALSSLALSRSQLDTVSSDSISGFCNECNDTLGVLWAWIIASSFEAASFTSHKAILELIHERLVHVG
jgi:hypothetical protein